MFNLWVSLSTEYWHVIFWRIDNWEVFYMFDDRQATTASNLPSIASSLSSTQGKFLKIAAIKIPHPCLLLKELSSFSSSLLGLLWCVYGFCLLFYRESESWNVKHAAAVPYSSFCMQPISSGAACKLISNLGFEPFEFHIWRFNISVSRNFPWGRILRKEVWIIVEAKGVFYKFRTNAEAKPRQQPGKYRTTNILIPTEGLRLHHGLETHFQLWERIPDPYDHRYLWLYVPLPIIKKTAEYAVTPCLARD